MQKCDSCGSDYCHPYKTGHGHIRYLCPFCALNEGFKAQMTSAATWVINHPKPISPAAPPQEADHE